MLQITKTDLLTACGRSSTPAKVIAESPVLAPLKKLEALEKLADTVQTLTVHDGTRGLLEEFVSLKGGQPKTSRVKA